MGPGRPALVAGPGLRGRWSSATAAPSPRPRPAARPRPRASGAALQAQLLSELDAARLAARSAARQLALAKAQAARQAAALARVARRLQAGDADRADWLAARESAWQSRRAAADARGEWAAAQARLEDVVQHPLDADVDTAVDATAPITDALPPPLVGHAGPR
ncbi:MAG: hypothetical protein U1F53_00895 [Burkholderiaceae bacterium]